jgi:acyl-CoA synthetase (AMP-forming)/AMP-acid ligase II
MSVRSFTIYDVFKRNAKLFGDKTAIRDEAATVSFGQLLDQTKVLIGGLAERGIGRGDRIAVLTKNCFSFFTLTGPLPR